MTMLARSPLLSAGIPGRLYARDSGDLASATPALAAS
jgi:hypothetical protein